MFKLWITLLVFSVPFSQQQDDLQEFMEQAKEDYKILGMAIEAFRSNEQILRGHVGVRHADDPTPIEEDDRYMLGDASKAITAVLAARIVDAGFLTWNSTIGEVLGDHLVGGSLLAQSTLFDLLVQHGQMMDNSDLLKSEEFMDWYDQVWEVSEWNDSEKNVEQRLSMAKFLTNCEDENENGRCDFCEEDVCLGKFSQFTYSVAVSMLEKITGKPFEVMLEEEVFGPLGISNCGVGPTTLDPSLPPSQPWSHFSGPWGVYNIPLSPGNQTNMPSSMAPDTGLHCSLDSWKIFLSSYITRDQSFLSQDTWELLVTPHNKIGGYLDYAMGFFVDHSNPIAGSILWQPSSSDAYSNKYYAELIVLPQADIGIVFGLNTGMKEGMRQKVGMTKILRFVEDHIYQKYGVSLGLERLTTVSY